MTDDPRFDTCRKDIARLESESRALKELITEQFRGRDEAVRQALLSMDKRLEQMNEFRKALEDTSNRSLGREEYRSGHDLLTTRMNRNDERLALLEGRGMTFNVIIPAAISLVVAAATLFLHFRQ